MCLITTGYVVYSTSLAHAQTPQSTNYRLDESTVGAGGLMQSNSANFQASAALGDVAVGEAASENFQIQPGSKTTNDPTLSFSINTPAANFGEFSAGTTAITTATFSVANYTSYGYAVHIAGDVPKNGSEEIDAMTTTAPSTPGLDQFGVNLVANTSPTSFGANPVYGLFGVGAATPNYGVSNEYRFISGEAIATAPKSSGVTTYTISYIANVESLKRGGTYKSNQTLIVTGTY